MPPVGVEPTIPASTRPQTYSLDRAATRIGAFVRSVYFLSQSWNYLHLVEPSGSRTCSERPACGPGPQADVSILHSPILSLQIKFEY
jgi:hypothetical protein